MKCLTDRYNWRGVTSVLIIKFLGSHLVAKKPYLMKTLRLTLTLQQPIFTECSNVFTYNLTDDETFSLWDSADFTFAAYTKQVYYIRSVVFIGS